MLIQSILVAFWAWFNGMVVSEYLVWIVRGAPLVSGTITGILMGDWRSGAMIGATIQLLYMGQVTVGGISSYDKSYAGIIATAVTIASHQTPEIGITLAVALGTLGLIASNIFMTVCVAFVHMADKYVEEGKTNRIWIYNWLLPNLLCGLLWGIPAFLAVYFGSSYLEAFMNHIPAFVSKALTTVGMILPALGIAMMLKTVFNPRFSPFIVVGFLCVAYLHMDIIACALLGGACAVLYWTLNLDKLTEGGN
ncbi:PTS mannose/fructose/sorbose/N-acetylgalactosamine transporter subunit IIC [Lacrimispora saccharolytica]|uniref:Phosphotransferase system PTS sorbose-specific IIC subunit n=1 Tax=Lacrimispora saccharolytica (strain ATCC 35040 / DSM 2544 / NRCC 2533 / WM1) TaxID=610130 RepID=D9R069_LACSW|nr:PTS sugar transporter subunit IIC [Lacrimispora saccharolytica]ADL04520.1 phosphotransferase system PTS sorbose-specific IIC subunit [[Clostridium] saccharolyticum WM1]QRV21225.1 PTS sugar transporter subunit IIC [Lacrimispora saccharolytica]